MVAFARLEAAKLLAAAAIAALCAGALAETDGERLTTEAILPRCRDRNQATWPYIGLTVVHSEIMWMTQITAVTGQKRPRDASNEVLDRDKRGRSVRFALPRPQAEGSDSSTYRIVRPKEPPPFEDEPICISVLCDDNWENILVAASLPPRTFRERRIIATVIGELSRTSNLSAADFDIVNDNAEVAAYRADRDLAMALWRMETLTPRHDAEPPIALLLSSVQLSTQWGVFPGLMDALMGTVVRVAVHWPGVQGRVALQPHATSNMLLMARKAHFQVCGSEGAKVVDGTTLARPSGVVGVRMSSRQQKLVGRTVRDAFNGEVCDASVKESALLPVPLCATSETLAWSARTRPRVYDRGALSASVPAPRLSNKGRFPLKSVLRAQSAPPEGLRDSAESGEDSK